LILDHNLGPIQAIRANWRITRGRACMLVKLKLRLWVEQILWLVFGLVLGFFLIEFYITIIWTAAYLDLIGNLPKIRQEFTDDFKSV